MRESKTKSLNHLLVRINHFPTCISALLILFCATKSEGQRTDSTSLQNIFKQSPIANDGSPADLPGKKSNEFPFYQISPVNNLLNSSTLKYNAATQTFINQFKFPVDFKNPGIAIKNISLSGQLANVSSATNGVSNNLYSSNLSTSVGISGLPFSFSYNSNSGWFDNMNQLNFGSARFDKDLFLAQIKKKVKDVINPEEFFQDALASIYSKREQGFNLLKNDLTAILTNQNSNLLNKVSDKINLENISRLGVDQFVNNILNESRIMVLEKESLLIHLQNKVTEQPNLSDSVKLLSGELEAALSLKEKLETEAASLRKKWAGNGVMDAIGGFEKEKQAAIAKLMNDPEAILKFAGQKLSFRGLQKLLLNARSLNLGASGISQSKLGMSDVLLKGISTEFLKGKRFFAPLLGTQPGIKNITDFSYSNFNELPNIVTAGLRMGKGDIKKDFSHVSMSLFQPSDNRQFLPGNFSASLPKNLVTTFSKKVSFGEAHSLLTEISKSTTLYNPSSEGSNAGFKDVINTDNFFNNMGITVDYGGEFEDIGVSEKLVVRYTGKEYNNLGNFSLVSGTKEISNDVKKYLFKRKLTVNVKAHYREYEFSIDKRKWTSFSYLADIKWKLKKGEFVEIRYQPYFNRRITVHESYLSSKSYRLAIRGNVNRKIAKGLTYRNFIELSTSEDNFYDLIQDKFNSNSFLSFVSLQTLAIGKQTLFVNITGSHARQQSDYLYGNSSLSIDAGTSFSAGKNIYLSMAVVYNEVNEMYGQLAIRQSISAMIGKKIVLEGFLHAGKNLYEQSYLRIPAVTGNLAVSYNLK